MKIAVVGTGIAGNVAAYLLAGEHDLTVFEQNDYVGGHTHTVSVDAEDGPHAVDAGFIAFNHERYPNFVKLLTRLGVPTRPCGMSFSVKCEDDGLEYSNRALFARKRNLLDPRVYRLVLDVVRFNRTARARLLSGGDDVRLGTFLKEERYSQAFIERFLYPMAAAIWSSDPTEMDQFPARFFAEFFTHHRFLDVLGQPEWQVIRGGSREYVKKLTHGFRDRIRVGTPVQAVRRDADGVVLKARGSEPERFDHVVLANHADQALAVLEDPTAEEREVLGAFRFQANEAVLHTDTRLLPRATRAWACWNAHVPRRATGKVAVTYDMNILQGLRAKKEYLVTLNRTAHIDPASILKTIRYEHPVYSSAAVRAQREHARISGHRRTHYAGAYWGFGFHEDGVNSALAVARAFGKGL